jgi:hypothetical protein
MQVLVIESVGPDDAPTIANPSVWFYNVGGSLDYHLPVAPSPRLNNRKFNMAFGHVLGGGSSINAMVWTRGMSKDELKQVGNIFRVVLDRQKTGTHINNVIPAWLGQELLKVKNGNPEYFFWTGLTTPEDAPSYFHKLYRKVFKAADVKGSSHHFRHTYAIELLKAGIDIRTVQKALGHSSLGTTEKYYSRWNLAQQDLMDASLQGALAGK